MGHALWVLTHSDKFLGDRADNFATFRNSTPNSGLRLTFILLRDDERREKVYDRPELRAFTLEPR